MEKNTSKLFSQIKFQFCIVHLLISFSFNHTEEKFVVSNFFHFFAMNSIRELFQKMSREILLRVYYRVANIFIIKI